MNKIWKISCHELTMHARRKSFYILLPLMQLLIIMALVGGWFYVEQSVKTQTVWQEEVQRQWEAQPDRHPHRVAHYGSYAFRAMTPLSFFDIGVNKFVGNSIYLEAHRQNSAMFSEAQMVGDNARFGQLSAATLLLIFWPLLLITLAYASITEERESGRLKQLLSNNLSMSHLLSGKFVAYVVISLAFLVPVFICGGILAFLSSVSFSTDIFLRLLLLFALYFSYSIVWLGIIFCCSFVSKYSQLSLTFLIVFWLLAVIVAPRVISSFATYLYDHPSRSEFEIELAEAIKAAGDSHNPNDPHYSDFKRKVLAQYGVEKIEDLPVNYAGLVMSEGEKQSALVFNQHYDKLLDTFSKQNAVNLYFYWVNPYLVARSLSMKITASNSAHFYHFEKAAEHYRFATTQKLNELHTNEIDAAQNKTQRASRHHWQGFVPFTYQLPKLGWSLEKTQIEFLSLLFWCALPFVVTFGITRTRSLYSTI
jgi:ABC-2 type transport system permease protein